MPHNKQQHYVPRCYLKPFSLNQDGAAINLFNISRRKHIENAPIKGQCARAYFYGEDLRIERWLQSFESEYAKIVREIQNRTQLAEDDLGVLRTFAYLQYSRTEMAIRRRRIAEEGMQNAVYEGRPVAAPDLDVGDRTIMLRSMLTYFQSREYVDDLKITILDNQTQVDFVTSDDPAVFVNRFYTQRVKCQSFGISSSGVLLILPITPRYALICYDGGVYTMPEKRGCYLSITRLRDTVALNELQYIKAAENIYYSHWDGRDQIETQFHQFAPVRPERWCDLTVWVVDRETAAETRYRRATEEEKQDAQHTLVSMSMIHPVPSHWLSKLHYRAPIRTFSNGSAAGHVRKAEWLRRSIEQPPR